MMAASAGAREVVAIENSMIVEEMHKVVRANGLSDKIKIFAGLAEDFDCGENKVDLIVSEWMGYCLLYENMLPSVLCVRDKCRCSGTGA